MLGCCGGTPDKDVVLLSSSKPSEATPLTASSRKTCGQHVFDCLTQGRPSNVEALPSTAVHAFFNEMMCLIGIGSLTLPYATAQVGIVLSMVGLALLCYFSWEGIRFVAICACEERKRRATLQLQGKHSALEDKGAWHVIATAAFGECGWRVVATTLSIAQIGVACGYVDQVRGTLQFLLNCDGRTSLSMLWAIFTVLCLQLNPGMRTVAYLSGFAFVSMTYIYVLVGYYALDDEDGHLEERGNYSLAVPGNIGVWYGPALFAFEGMGSALSIYDSMGSVDPKPFTTMMSYAYSLAALSYAYIILFGYLGWGDTISRMVTHNFPNTPVGNSADYLLSLSLTCSFVLQMTPVFQMAEEAIPVGIPFWSEWAWIPARALLVGCVIALSALIPSVEKICGLTGALAFSLLCFVYPALLFLKLNPRPGARYEKGLAIAFIPIGLVLGTWGLVAELQDSDNAFLPGGAIQVGENTAPARYNHTGHFNHHNGFDSGFDGNHHLTEKALTASALDATSAAKESWYLPSPPAPATSPPVPVAHKPSPPPSPTSHEVPLPDARIEAYGGEPRKGAS